MKLTFKILKIIALLAALVGAYFGIRELATSEVVVAPVRRGSAANSATGSVTVVPELEARIIAPEKGNLIQFGFTDETGRERNYMEGDRVVKGQVVAKLDPGRLPYDLAQLESDRDRILERKKRGSAQQANFDLLQKNLEASIKLRDKGHRAEADVRELESRLKSLGDSIALESMEIDYSLRRTELQIKQIKDQLERFEIRAPFDGVIMAPSAVVGDLIFAGNSIGKITSTRKIIKVEVNQDDLSAVKNSKQVSVRFFSFPDRDYKIAKGKRPQIVPVGNSSTQRFTVFVPLESLPEGLMSGQTGEATFVADEHLNVLLVPVTALVGDSVFVLKDNRLEKRRVKTDFVTITSVEIIEGLAEGELVVSRDVDMQRDGDRVRIKQAK